MNIDNGRVNFTDTNQRYMEAIFSSEFTAEVNDYSDNQEILILINKKYEVPFNTLKNILEDKAFTIDDFDFYKVAEQPVTQLAEQLVQQAEQQTQTPIEKLFGMVSDKLAGDADEKFVGGFEREDKDEEPEDAERVELDTLRYMITKYDIKITPRIIKAFLDNNNYSIIEFMNVPELLALFKFTNSRAVDRKINDRIWQLRDQLTIPQLYDYILNGEVNARGYLYDKLRQLTTITNEDAVYLACDEHLPAELSHRFL